MAFAYTVTADFDSLPVAAEWVEWLQHGHLQEVLDGGALEATLVRVEPTPEAPLRFEARYLFPDVARFAEYEKGPAVRLRAEGAARFPPTRGVRMTRRHGEVLTRLSRSPA
jgi:hypothetical protein